jgi:porphobilinogen synthase
VRISRLVVAAIRGDEQTRSGAAGADGSDERREQQATGGGHVYTMTRAKRNDKTCYPFRVAVMSFPTSRPRRLRATAGLRELVRETRLSPRCLIWPLFFHATLETHRPVATMPGVSQLPVKGARQVAKDAAARGLGAVILFGLPNTKDERGTSALDVDGPIPRAVAEMKSAVPGLVVMTDVCVDEYTDHGHCGILRKRSDGEMEVDNDATIEVLAEMALVHARAGADVVAPSDMMDGRVGRIRRALDESGFQSTSILSYAAKYASAFYGPFREAADCAPKFGDRAGYQMDPANVREALREVRLDEQEGADMLMVKPALAYLDVIRAVRADTTLPLFAYNVSGEYAMLKAAAAAGMIDYERAMMEVLVSIHRAGADGILTYHAVEAAEVLGA